MSRTSDRIGAMFFLALYGCMVLLFWCLFTVNSYLNIFRIHFIIVRSKGSLDLLLRSFVSYRKILVFLLGRHGSDYIKWCNCLLVHGWYTGKTIYYPFVNYFQLSKENCVKWVPVTLWDSQTKKKGQITLFVLINKDQITH